nr:uncharacterized protein LOC119163158 isoform X1 [Rhipicephalus microplus]
MTTLLLTRLAGAALLLATLVLGQGTGGKAICDKQAIAGCYWGLADQYGKMALTDSAENKDSYMSSLCHSDPHGFPEEIECKRDRYASCTDAEKKEFASMERGYAALRAEITSKDCGAVVQLAQCMDLEAIRTCDTIMNAGSFEKQIDEQNRVAQNLKVCVEKAVKTCDAKKNAAAISHLQKITEAIIDLYRLSDKPNGTPTTQAATAVIVTSLLSLVALNFF